MPCNCMKKKLKRTHRKLRINRIRKRYPNPDGGWLIPNFLEVLAGSSALIRHIKS